MSLEGKAPESADGDARLLSPSACTSRRRSAHRLRWCLRQILDELESAADLDPDEIPTLLAEVECIKAVLTERMMSISLQQETEPKPLNKLESDLMTVKLIQEKPEEQTIRVTVIEPEREELTVRVNVIQEKSEVVPVRAKVIVEEPEVVTVKAKVIVEEPEVVTVRAKVIVEEPELITLELEVWKELGNIVRNEIMLLPEVERTSERVERFLYNRVEKDGVRRREVRAFCRVRLRTEERKLGRTRAKVVVGLTEDGHQTRRSGEA